MEGRIIENNRVTVSGEIVSDFSLNHELYGERFYTASLSIKRESGTADIIPIMVSDRLVDVKSDWNGRKVKVEGQFRSYDKIDDGRRHLFLSVFARGFEEIGEIPFWNDENNIFLDGYICKQPAYRKTPSGREISDILLAASRPYGKSDYIPCICWGRNARFAEKLEVGTHIQADGRIQSRTYQKKISDGEFETRTAYEVSVRKISVVEETEEGKDAE